MAGRLQLEPNDQRIFTSIMTRIAKTRLIANASKVNAAMHQELVASAMRDIEGWTRELRIVANRVSALNQQIAELGEGEELVISKMNDVLQRIANGLAGEEELVTLENELRRIQRDSRDKMVAYDQARTELTRLIAAIKGELASAPDEGGPRGGPPTAPAQRSLWDRLIGRNRPGATAVPRPAGSTAVGLGRQGSDVSEYEAPGRLGPMGSAMSDDEFNRLMALNEAEVEEDERQRQLEARGAEEDNPLLFSRQYPAEASRLRAQSDSDDEAQLGGGGSSLRRGGYTYPKKRTLRRRRRRQNKARKTHHAKKAHKKKQKTRGRKVHKKRATHRRRR